MALLAFAEAQDPALSQRIDETGKLPPEDKEAILALTRRFLAERKAGA